MWKRKDTSILVETVKISETADGNRTTRGTAGYTRLVLLVLLSHSFIYWLISMLELDVSMQLINWNIALMSIWFYLVLYRKWKQKLTLPATVCLLALYMLMSWEKISNGLSMILNEVSLLVKKYYGTGFGEFEALYRPSDLEAAISFIAVLFLCLFAYGIFRRRRTLIFTYLTVILLCVCLLLDQFPDIPAAALWISAYLGLRAMGKKPKGKTLEYAQTQAALGVLAAAGILCGLSYGLLQPYFMDNAVKNHDRMMRLQADIEVRIEDSLLRSPFSKWEIFSGFTWGGKVESGELTNQSPGRTGRTAMTVTVDQKPEANLYMRGFIGDIYEGNRWREIPESGVEESVKQQLFQLPVSLLKESEDVSTIYPGTFEMQLKDVNGSYGYLPYFANLDSLSAPGVVLKGDGETKRKSDLLRFDGYLYHDASDFWIWQERVMDSQPVVDEQYREYRKKNYLYVPKEGIDTLQETALEIQELLKSLGDVGIGDLDVAALTSLVLSERCTYSLNLAPLPEGKDYTEFFLGEQKKGFCTHFASTGTLLLRIMGIPSRYVTGYVVKPDQFKKDAEKNTFTAVVSDGAAHAWVEIYDDSLGWIPVEMTPGSATADTMAPNSNGESQTPTESAQRPTDIPEPTDNPAPEISKDPGKGEQTGVAVNSKANSLLQFFWKVMTVVLTVVLLALVLIIRRKWIWSARNKRFSVKSLRKAVENISYETYRLLKASGHKQSENESDASYAAEIQKAFPQLGVNTFVKFVEKAQKAKFSADTLTQSDVKFCRDVYRELGKCIYGKSGCFKKFWWQFIKCY